MNSASPSGLTPTFMILASLSISYEDDEDLIIFKECNVAADQATTELNLLTGQSVALK